MRAAAFVGLCLTFELAVAPACAQPSGDAQQRLQGSWVATKAEQDGKEAKDLVGHRISFAGSRFQIRSKDGKLVYGGTFKAMAASAGPAAIDFDHSEGTLNGKVWKGLYGLEGDVLNICDNAPDLDKGRPTALEAKARSGYVCITFNRSKP